MHQSILLVVFVTLCLQVPAARAAPAEPKPAAQATDEKARPAPPGITDPGRARRLARAIAADIALYNQEEVQKARTTGVVPEKLAGEIEEGRTLFRARVSPEHAALYKDAISEIVLRSVLAGILPASLSGAEAACLGAEDELPMAQLGPDGSVHGLPVDHRGPMRLAAPPSLSFAKAAIAIGELQRVGGRLAVVAAGPGGRQVAVPVSLENELSCVPLPAAGICKRQRQPTPILAVVGAGAGEPEEKLPAPLTLQVEVLAEKLLVRAAHRAIPTTLAKLDALLKGLIEKHDGAVTIYVNATGGTAWQAVVSTLAISHCRLKAAPAQGFDAVLLGSPPR